MGLQPELNKRRSFKLKECTICHQSFGPESFAPTKSEFYPDGAIPICNFCIDKKIEDHHQEWSYVDKLCQMVDIPFVPAEWEKLSEMHPDHLFYKYAQIFMGSEHDTIGWDDYYKAFKQLKDQNSLEDELPRLHDEKLKQLKQRWGANYDQEELDYLERLYNGLLASQNVAGALQIDQAYKLCKISLAIDSCIRSGEPFDKLLSSYDKLVHTAEFTPKNVKNINDFDTCGELIKWLEKRGWKNQYYDNVPRDIVDETIANMQSYNQRLYTNETGIGEEITKRLEALKQAEKLEQSDYYATGTEIIDLDKYEDDGYDKLISADEDFDPDLEVGDV